VKGQLDAGTIRGRGELEVLSSLRGENIKFTGNIDIKGDCEAGTFDMFGGFDVKVLLSADWLVVKMYGPCRAREIGGAKLRVKRSKPAVLLRLIKPISAAVLIADLIEGDIIDLEYSTVGIVRGNSVIIGPGCEIERVEYRETLDVHKSAIVKERIKL
jgi:cytoskeletal protein CcmA (bactofilin family)